MLVNGRRRRPPDQLWLVCRPNFDIYLGAVGVYCERLGNLKQDGATKTFAGAVGRLPFDRDQLYYRLDEFPPIDQLVQQVGNAQGEAIHFYAGSIRFVWLDRFFRSYKGRNAKR